ncbi:sensor histidine kinase [Gorillibacterium sp. sgz5001074]|uniref:sensor histidine kinase n=1 Tax=Gorillibacterium sp. sgz5001074 TaxID=3446695 RepID=UPI003F6667D9
MNPPLAILRYLLLLAAAVAMPYYTEISSFPVYISQILLLLCLVRIRERPLTAPYATLLFAAEAVWTAWLVHTYGSMLFILFWSLAVSLFDRHAPALRFQLAGVLLILMNLSLSGAPDARPFEANSGFLALSLVLFRSVKTEVGREELQQLYDELRRKHYELEEARARILEYARIVEDSAQAEERNRIAREIHDDLGHKLIRLKMMLEAVLHIMPEHPDKGMEMIRQVRDQLTDSMESMRKTVRKLKPEEADVHSWSLEKLIEELSREPGFRIRYQVRGAPVPLYPSCEIVLYRNTQEAITNAIRHGGADEIEVELRYGDSSVELTVSNNGTVPKDMGRKGLGVSGMEERTRLVGGELAFDMTGRFAVTTRIPTVRT